MGPPTWGSCSRSLGLRPAHVMHASPAEDIACQQRLYFPFIQRLCLVVLLWLLKAPACPECCCTPWPAVPLHDGVPLFAAGQMCWDGCMVVAGTACCCETLAWSSSCFGSRTDCQHVCHHLMSSTGGPAGFLKCKSQLQCDVHPFSFFFFSLPSCFNSNVLSMLSLCKTTGLGALLELLCAMDAEDTSCTGSQTSAAVCC